MDYDRAHQPRAGLREERATTLIELLVAIAAGTVVVVALFSLLDASLRQERRISNYTQADNTGRTAIATVVEELDSTCTGFTKESRGIQAPVATPVAPLEKTSATSLWFITTYETQASAKPLPSATEQDIEWIKTGETAAKEPFGELVDYVFSGGDAGGETAPAFPNSSARLETKAAIATHVLARGVVPALIEGKRAIFQYFRYKTNPENGELESKPMTPPFIPGVAETEKGELASEVAKVNVSFEQLPEDDQTNIDQAILVSDSVSLRFGPTEAPVGRTDQPCA